MSASSFWRFASTLEKEFGCFYDRDEEFVECVECGEPLYSCDWETPDYMQSTSDGYLIYKCPVCGAILCVVEIDK
jgi:translation initiation factor 2 beta subunit (eIF-2beta)/eIF-5